MKNVRRFTYAWIMRFHLNNATTVLDVGCGDGDLMKSVNFDKKYEITGVDLYKPYLEKVKQSGVYKNAVYGDIRKMHFKHKIYDCVLSSQVIEHLTKNESLRLIKSMEKLAKKRVIIGTTNGFFPFEPLGSEDKNPLQVHKSGWSIREMKSYGYRVYGQGLGIVYKPGGLAHSLPTFSFFWMILSYIFSPITHIFPQIGTYIISVKEIGH